MSPKIILQRKQESSFGVKRWSADLTTRQLRLPEIKSIMRFCRNPSSRLTSPYILALPNEVWDDILGYLEPEDQAWSVLSCKSLYHNFRTVLQHSELRLTPLQGPRPLLCCNVEGKPRTRFLRRLEDARWKFCGPCWKLHHPSIWNKPKKHCQQCQTLDKPTCMPYAGIVDLCPCLSITFFGRDDVKALAESMAMDPHTGDKTLYHGLMYHQEKGTAIWHHCKITNHPFVEAEARTGFYTLNYEHQLRVVNKYWIHVSTRALPSPVKPLFVCPHVDIMVHIGQLFEHRESGFTGCARHDQSVLCKTCAITLSRGESSQDFVVTVIRTLGNYQFPDPSWQRHRR